VYGTMAALSRMRPRGQGTIVQVGSALSSRSIPLQSAYCGAKHAINGFTSSLRCELLHEHSGVHVTVVQMPAVNTPQFSWVRSRLPNHPQPVPPIYQPEVAARLEAYRSAGGVWDPRFAADMENRLPVILELPAVGNTDDSHNHIRLGTSMPMRSRARVSCARTYATPAARQRFRSTRSSLRIGYRW